MFEIICFIQIKGLDLGNQIKTIMTIYNLVFITIIALLIPLVAIAFIPDNAAEFIALIGIIFITILSLNL